MDKKKIAAAIVFYYIEYLASGLIADIIFETCRNSKFKITDDLEEQDLCLRNKHGTFINLDYLNGVHWEVMELLKPEISDDLLKTTYCNTLVFTFYCLTSESWLADILKK